jgi:membrane protein
MFANSWKLLKHTFAAWQRDEAARRGAALAFYSVLSLGPLLLLVLVAAAFIWGRRAAQGQIVTEMAGLVGPEGAAAIQSILKTASENRHGGIVATILGVAMLMFSASGAFGELQHAMNTIWKVPERQGKKLALLLRARFLSFSMVLGTAFLLLISLVLSAAFAALASFLSRQFPILATMMPVTDFVVSLIMITLLFGVIFKYVPDRKIAWRSVWPGAALTAVLFVVGKMLIGLYLSHTGVASSYGAAGSVVIILLWVYYSAQILFFGAEFVHAYDEACKAQIS